MIYQVVEKIGQDEHVYDEFKTKKDARKFAGRCRKLEIRPLRTKQFERT